MLPVILKNEDKMWNKSKRKWICRIFYFCQTSNAKHKKHGSEFKSRNISTFFSTPEKYVIVFNHSIISTGILY